MNRILKALLYSRDGLVSAFKSEMAFRQEVLLFVVLLPVAMLVDTPAVGKVAIVASMLLVLIVELLNSAVDAVVDLASPEKHDLAKKAKDYGSAAVLLSLVISAGCWGVALWG